MAATKYPLVNEDAVTVGASFVLNMRWKDGNGTPIDLTNYLASIQFRYKETDASPALAGTEADKITLGGAAGTIDIEFTPADTAVLKAGWGVYAFELVNPSGRKIPMLYGPAEYKRDLIT